jgi:hypothetical protein
MKTQQTCSGIALGVLATAIIASAAFGHDGVQTSDAGVAIPPPATLEQLEHVRHATARFLEVENAIEDGYVDIGVFYPNMGWHYLHPDRLDGVFEADKPELLVYVDDPCTGQRRLVAVEYAVPLALADRAPAGFAGSTDGWVVNERFQLWTLHAWLWEFNPDGIFAAHNVRVP